MVACPTFMPEISLRIIKPHEGNMILQVQTCTHLRHDGTTGEPRYNLDISISPIPIISVAPMNTPFHLHSILMGTGSQNVRIDLLI